LPVVAVTVVAVTLVAFTLVAVTAPENVASPVVELILKV